MQIFIFLPRLFLLHFLDFRLDMATEVFDFDGAGERYKFLLHPLKDLASNWDVDIAKTLEDYIKKVVDENDSAVLVDQNGRRKIFNFTEAALLIHGTTSVYVKKVDYVHQLALNFFDQLREDPKQEKKRNKANQPENEGGEDGAADILDGGGNESGGEDAQLQRKEKQKPKVNYSAMRSVLERLSQRQAPTFPLVPISFIPLSDFEKSDVPLFSRTNAKEQIGKKDDFRINSCHIYESVALLDIKNISLVDKFTSAAKKASSSQHESLEQEMNTLNTNNDQTLFHLDDIVEENGQGMQTLQRDSDQTLMPFDDIGDGGDDAVNEIVVNTMNEIVPETPEVVNEPDENNGIEEEIQAEEPKEKTPENENRMEEEIRASREPEVVNEPLSWEELLQDHLDPQEVVKEHSRPYKKVNCTMNAEKQIKARERRIERECKERGVPNERSIKSYIDSQMFRKPLRKRNFVFGQFNTFLMDQAVLALNPQIYEEEKRRNDLKKKRRKEKQAMEREERARHRSSQRQTLDPVLDHPNDEEDEGGEEIVPQEQNENINGIGGGEEDEFEDGIEQIIAEDIHAFDDSGDDDNHTHLGDLLELDDLHNSLGGIRNMYTGFQHLINTKSRGKNASRLAKSVRNAYDDTFMMDGGPFNPDEVPNRPSSQMNHDEIIAFHLRKYWAAAEAAVSKFSERMEMWEAKMNLALEKEQKYREFDTREYGDEVLKKFDGEIGNEFDFTQMLGSVPNEYDRSRYLLVTLILANMENVEINVAENANSNNRDYSLEMGKLAPNTQMDQINVKLLKLERHHQVFEEEQRLLTGNPING